MSWSLNIGRVAGTVVRIHLTFLLFLAWIFAASYAAGGAATAWDSLAFMVLLFLCVLLHEFGHIFTARAFGVPTPYVTLLPIGGVAQLERIPEEPWEEFLIAIAGPLVNVVITLVLVYVAGADLQSSAAMAVDNMHIPLIDRLAAVNLFLALFNLIPAFPMDGGRVLRAASRGVPVSHAMMTQLESLSPQAHLDEAVQTLLHTGQGEFPVVDGTGKPVGVLDRGALIRAIKTLGPDARVSDAMSAALPTVSQRATLEQAFKLLQQKQAPAVGVVDANGALVGLVTGETIAEMMMLQGALPEGLRGPWGRPAGDVGASS